MKNLLASIKEGSAVFDVQAMGQSWVIAPKDGRETEFSRIIDELTFGDDEQFVVLPVCDGRGGYVRAVVMPLEHSAEVELQKLAGEAMEKSPLGPRSYRVG